jgi:hypothetical protein
MKINKPAKPNHAPRNARAFARRMLRNEAHNEGLGSTRQRKEARNWRSTLDVPAGDAAEFDPVVDTFPDG